MKQNPIYTVSQVNRYLKKIILNDMVLQDIRVLGEISNFKFHKPSGHMYFTLKDGDNLLRAVFFKSKNQQLSFMPSEGMNVVARGNTSIYERSGTFQLYVEELEPEGQGALYQAFEKLKAELQQQGLFDAAHKKPLPYIPRKVGVITSPTGAAIRDFIAALQRRFPYLHVSIFPVAVQGRDSPSQIVNALKKMDVQGVYDILVLTRGGGSLEELWSFNDEDVARAIFSTKTPVVSAVGHETDFTIADFVADHRASTPTAAAELITPDKHDLIKQLSVMEARLKSFVNNNILRRFHLLKHLSSNRSMKYVLDKINHQAIRIDELGQRLIRGMEYDLKIKRSTVKSLEDRMNSLNPANIMERGFALVVDENNMIIKTIDHVSVEKDLEIVFADGRARCQVKRINKKGL